MYNMYRSRGISAVGSAFEWHSKGQGFDSPMLHHKRTLILIQRLAFFLCSKSLVPQGFFHYVGCMERAFSLFFGCKWRLMLVSPYSTLPVGCMIKRLLVVELVAVLYWVHPFFASPTHLLAQLTHASGLRNAILSCALTECVVYLSYSVLSTSEVSLWRFAIKSFGNC